jgi:hypothetical protein
MELPAVPRFAFMYVRHDTKKCGVCVSEFVCLGVGCVLVTPSDSGVTALLALVSLMLPLCLLGFFGLVTAVTPFLVKVSI